MLYHALWVFFVYAFLGWCTEVSYAATKSGKFVNRGFLNGPWCPIYGFGVVIVLAFLEPLKDNLFLLFLGSVILTSALEWLTGFLLEKLFAQRWWDYSDEPFNLSGYICLRFSLAWGFACLFVVKLLHPTVLLLIRLIPHLVGLVLLGILVVVMAIDLAATVSAIAKLNRRLALIDELAGHIREASNDFGEDLAERVLDAAEKGADWREDLEELSDRLSQRREEFSDDLDELKDDFQARLEARKAQNRQQLQEWKDAIQALMDKESFGQKRLLKAFPSLRSLQHRAAMDRLRRHQNHS
uniref:putative ABC transporter permease n=1 Tax=unclassified Lawsonibacter TaxID=2617946 RepID=UPI003F9B6730